MEHLLFLSHRIPYPPNKGDKIRSYHLLKHLAQRYQVHLGTFVDDESDAQYIDTVKRLCKAAYFAPLNPRVARLCSLPALVADRPLTLDYYRHAGLKAWVRQLLDSTPVTRVMVFSSAMAQYAEDALSARRVIDFVDVDSAKWTQYGEEKNWPMNWLYRREGRTLLRYERKIAETFDASLFVSAPEAALFRQMAPESAAKIGFYSNGVDTEYFSPAHHFQNPYKPDEQAIVFTGAMDYWPNIDAVRWMAEAMMPGIRATNPNAVFYIVGSRPTPQVQALASLPGVKVTGSVPDVRPYLAHARCAVAPLRVARGIQNKVLEAMAMAKPIVVTSQALEGIDAQPGRDLHLADTVDQITERLIGLLANPDQGMGCMARDRVLAAYGWASNLAGVNALLEGSLGSTSAVPTAVSPHTALEKA